MQLIDGVLRTRQPAAETHGRRGIAVSRNEVQRDIGGINEIIANGNCGRECSNECCAVDAFAAVRQCRVAACQIGRERRAARAHPAVQVGTYLRADPFVIVTVGAQAQVEPRRVAVDEFVGHVVQ